ncbi:hypothetical protein QBC33DRAFT_554831 [Phialemonium atrogriseum]|uniref:Prp 4 CRoW domain-containing protein n=1 Tax=Phialemonium atrogriseum TaxID=1093897 RepID=A0AAJ0C7N7_9PEZI|nr:uncharacterized protein QBC33DRAFT_554831 [Phialemonium atrogriseum]KAK1771669.1 hypothetical protein QBC33DRAFT_554831 [Phialemonium atrogriseum]
MLVKSASALAVLAFAAHASASEAMPYKPLMRMSVRQMFGLVRRQDDAGYQPTQAVCGTGNTCAEACGAGYEACSSSDEMVHCFNPGAQTCCPDASGNSCDAGYYCTADTGGETWCCPDGMDVVACAAAYNIDGGLVSETPEPATSSVPSSTYAPATTSSYIAVSSYTPSKNATVTATGYNTTTSCPVSTVGPSASYPAQNATATQFTPSGSPSPTEVTVSGASVAGPAGVLALIAAVGVAVLL